MKTDGVIRSIDERKRLLDESRSGDFFRNVRDGAKTVMSAVCELVYPRRCPVCDRPVKPAGSLICPECETMLVRVQEPVCRRCGKPLSPGRAHFCRDCSTVPHMYDRGYAVFTYRSAAGSIFRFKYRGRREYGTYFGRCMAEKLFEISGKGRGEDWRSAAEFYPGETAEMPDLLIPVPVSARRLEKRGYNQAAVLAGEISRITGVPVRNDILRRVSDTRPMKNMAPSERQNNLKRAFQAFGNDVELNSIMLIDDIYTTGTTADACAAVLYRQGARKVSFLALAIGEE